MTTCLYVAVWIQSHSIMWYYSCKYATLDILVAITSILSFAVQVFSARGAREYRDNHTACAAIQQRLPFFSPQQRARTGFAARSKRDHARDDRTYSTVGSTGCPVLYSAIPVKHGTRIPHITGSVHYPSLACIRDPLHVFTGPYVCAVFPVHHT